jgi:hypothetical protein
LKWKKQRQQHAEENSNHHLKVSKRKRIVEAAQRGMSLGVKKAKSDGPTSKPTTTTTATTMTTMGGETLTVNNDKNEASTRDHRINEGVEDSVSESSQPLTEWEQACNLPGTNKMSADD